MSLDVDVIGRFPCLSSFDLQGTISQMIAEPFRLLLWECIEHN